MKFSNLIESYRNQILKESFDKDFDRANEVIHKVEDEWFYDRLTEYGWTSNVKELPGFVRHYEFTHEDFPNSKIKAAVGANADYWEHLIIDTNIKQDSGVYAYTPPRNGKFKTVGGGYGSDLKPYLDKLSKEGEDI